MKRSISLYIGDTRADLQDDTFVVFNYALTNLTNPAIQRNSWSQSVTLPRTPANNKLFGDAFRVDRTAGTGGSGAAFNASRKTSFAIYSAAGEIVVSGYLKLDAVTPSGYEVSLFGGLGSFYYALSYDEAGNKRTLADLDYGMSLDFDITAQAVLDAWARLGGDTSKPAMWDVINFAPCYDGIPDKFGADKALAIPADVGLHSNFIKDGKTYYPASSGHYLFSLAEAVDGWAAHDLRSYLQRPVLSVWKMLQALARPENSGGWTLDLTDINDTDKWPLRDCWLTRPLLPSLGTYKQETGVAAITPRSSSYTNGTRIAVWDISGATPGSRITATVSADLQFRVPNTTETRLRSILMHPVSVLFIVREIVSVFFLQAVALASDGVTVVGSSTVKAINASTVAARDIATAANYYPVGGAEIISIGSGEFSRVSSGVYKHDSAAPSFSLAGTDIATIELRCTAFDVAIGSSGQILAVTGGEHSYATLFELDNDTVTPTGGMGVPVSATATAMGADSLRSGAHITQQMLLTTDGTPADYLLAICKTFGWYVLADDTTKTARILRRDTFYDTGLPTIDATTRLDTSNGFALRPLAFDAKWYEFRHPVAEGAFAKEYKATEGVDYGIQRVDTGYDFDASSKEVLSGTVLRSCAAVRDHSPYWYWIENGGSYNPSLFLIAGGKYTGWAQDGSNADADTPQPDPAGMHDYGREPGYDLGYSRPEFRAADGKPVNGQDVLLVWAGTYDNLKHFRVTDDVPAMDALTGGPCWLLGPNAGGVDVPLFTRTLWDGQPGQAMGRSLDFGYPRQVDIPKYDCNGPTLYEAGWRSYLRDRLSAHGKVLKARVLLDGLQVGPELLRRFWWFGGALWVLNAINNYSLTTFDPAECEFIQVRDMNAYTNGQY
jgi:hypothetical protein